MRHSRGVPVTDVAMMAPVPGRGLRVPMLASGDGADRYARLLTPLGADVEVLAGPAGLAATGSCCAACSTRAWRRPSSRRSRPPAPPAMSSGCASTSTPSWPRPTRAAVERIVDGTARHAVRRAAEMEAAAEMLTELGVPPVMADASRALHERLSDTPDPLRRAVRAPRPAA